MKIRSVKSGEESVYTYADLKLAGNQKLPLAPGTYVVSAESPDHADYMAGTSCADWERPVYFGSVTKNVIKRTETQVNDLVCTLANIKTTVTLTQDLQELFMSDAEAEAAGKEKLTVTLSTTGSFSTVPPPMRAKRAISRLWRHRIPSRWCSPDSITRRRPTKRRSMSP